MSAIRILIVDDEPDVHEFLGYNLSRAGYTVYNAYNGKQALSLALEIKPHLMLLDVMMPEMDGMETCRELKRMPELNSVVIAFLSARSEDYTQIAGLDSGADDYIPKPVRPDLLISRVKALLRRNPENQTPSHTLIAGDLVVDRSRYLIQKNGQKFLLPKKEFELLFLLVSKPNRVLTREEIFVAVWGNNVVVGDRTIDVHIRRLREKIGLHNIKTIKGIGYKYEV